MAIASPARAAPDDIVSRPLVLAPGEVAAELVVEINAAPSYLGRPLSLAPDVWWGVAQRFTVGLIHSDPSVDRIEAGASMCVRSGLLACDRVYHGGGVELTWSALDGRFQLAPLARFLIRDIDPWKPAAMLGARGRWQHGRIAVTASPYLQVGLANTDHGNRTAIVVPVDVAVQPTCRWAVILSTGWNTDLAVWRDGWHVPVAVGARVRASARLDVAATLGFTTLLGPLNTPKDRVVFVSVGWREP